MLDLKFIRENSQAVQEAARLKRVNLKMDELLAADQELLNLKKKTQALNEEKNANAKKMKSAKPEEREAIISRGREVNQEIEDAKPELEKAEARLLESFHPHPISEHLDVIVDDVREIIHGVTLTQFPR